MGTTSNGRPWGENTGRVASGVFYGYAVKKGIEAAQRRKPTESATAWTTPVAAADLAFRWVLLAGVFIIQAWTITNGVVMTLVNYSDPMQHGHLTKGTGDGVRCPRFGVLAHVCVGCTGQGAPGSEAATQAQRQVPQLAVLLEGVARPLLHPPVDVLVVLHLDSLTGASPPTNGSADPRTCRHRRPR